MINHSVKLTPISQQELWNKINSKSNNILNGIVELFETIINLIKSNNYSIETLKELNKYNYNKKNNAIIISLIEPLYNAYQNYLTENQEIDFNDMINLATKYIIENKYTNHYKYVVDEYQDISKARYSLLKALRESNDFNLFCVGDDWQSIYRFAGSDIGLILNFEKYWGPSDISKIETTYRFSQKLIEISDKFIMTNPNQVRKNIQGRNDYLKFPLSEIKGYNEKIAVELMANKLDELPQNSSIFFIGRYSFDINILKENYFFNYKYNNVEGTINIVYQKRKDLKITFITAHKSKGLQADYIFIINNKKSKIGFPSKMQDDPILNLLLDNCDTFPYSEERRLFYVALTRTKRKVILLTIQNQESEFINEIH